MSDSPAPALVLDAHLKSSLAAIRSLGRRGIPVIAASHRPFAMGFYSRYVREKLVHPSPFANCGSFAGVIKKKACELGRPVLFAFSDSTLLPLVETWRAGEYWNWLLPPSLHCFDVAFDKGRTLELARAVNIDSPATYCQPTGAGLDAFLEEHDFPLVVKPRRSVYWPGGEGNFGIQVTASFATCSDELKRKCAHAVTQTGEFPLVQEYVAGEEASAQFLCDHGTVVAACANRRLRSTSPGGGPGALKVTVPLSSHGMAERGQRLASALNWSGPMMVEFKIDRVTGTPKLMEINGRFWGSLPLAVLAGIDFPYLYYRLSLGEHVEPSAHYPEALVSRHFMGDLHHLLAALFKRDPMRSSSYPTRTSALRDFLILPRGTRSDVLDRKDPMPAFAEMIDTASGMFSRLSTSTEPARSRDRHLAKREPASAEDSGFHG